MKYLLTLSLAFVIAGADAQNEMKFDKIRLAGSAKVELIQSETTSVTLDDDTPASAKLFTVENGWLTIAGKSGDELTVRVPSVSKIDIAGTGKLETEGVFKANEIELMVSGIGKIEMNVEAGKIQNIISGSGKIELEGSADEMTIDISGSGKIDAENLKVNTATVNISGSGKSLVDVKDTLNVFISGSGGVYYVNPPATLNKNISGIGKVGDADASITDTTRISVGNKKILIIDDENGSARLGFKEMAGIGSDKVSSHWAGFELGVNMLMDDNFSTEPPAGYEFLDPKIEKSIAVNFNVVDFDIPLYRRNIMLVTGLGFSINNFRFNSDSYLAPDADSVTAISDPSITLKKNKLVAEYINVPLLLEFNTSQNPKRTVHIATGVIGGLRVGSRVKMIQAQNGNESKVKIYDDFNLNPFRCDATARIGYRNFTVFASYGLVNLFKDNKGPDLVPFTAGIKLIGW